MKNVTCAINMTVRIIPIIIIVAILTTSQCGANLNFFSSIAKFYNSNVKSLRNFFNSNEGHSNDDVWLYDNRINHNNEIHEADNRYWIQNNYRKGNGFYGVRF